MTRTHPLTDRLRAALEAGGLEVTAFIPIPDELRPGQLVVLVVSPEFTGMDDVDRQVRVWTVLQNGFSEGERERVAFVFTESPEEFADRAKRTA